MRPAKPPPRAIRAPVAGIRPFLEPVACPICDGTSADPVGVGYDFLRGPGCTTSGDAFVAVRCSSCGLLFLEVRPAAESVQTRRSLESGPPAQAADFARLGARWRRKREAETIVLDLEGCQALLEGSVPAGPDSSGPSRAIVLPGVLGRVRDPVGLLRAAREQLAESGRVEVAVVNAAGPLFQLFRHGYWGGYDFPRRLQWFDRHSLSRLAEAAGYEVENIGTASAAAVWTDTIRNCLTGLNASEITIRRMSASSVARLSCSVLDGIGRLFGASALLTATLRPSPAGPPVGSRGSGTATHGAAPSIVGRASEPVLILGGGFAGLIAARELKRLGVPVRVFEASPDLGGLARSFRDADGFSYDFGAHFITNRLAAVLGMADRCRVVRRYGESVLLDGRTYAYPFGLLRSGPMVASAVAAKGRNVVRREAPDSARAWFEAMYGRELADRVAVPLVEAWSGARAGDLAPSVGDKLPGTLHALWLKASARLSDRAVGCGYSGTQRENWNVWHVYPRDGVGSMIAELAAPLRDEIRVGSPVGRIAVDGDRVAGVVSNGEQFEGRRLVSTAPVHVLAHLVDGPQLEWLADFRYRPMIFVNLLLEGRGFLPTTMLWTPEERFPFFRLAEAPLAMPWLAPEGRTIVTADIGSDVGDEMWAMEDDDLARLCLEALEQYAPNVSSKYIRYRVLRTRFAYPVYLKKYESARRRFRESTGIEGLYSIGRNGRFSHDLMEDVYWSTRRVVQSLVRSRRSS